MAESIQAPTPSRSRTRPFVGRIILAAGLAAAITGCQTGGSTQPTSPAPPPSAPASTGTSAAGQARQWTMPNLVGSTLQQAQNTIQKLTDNAIFFSASHDATGKNRSQVLDANWKVCSQNIPAGTAITATSKIDFGAVKLSEPCP